MIRLMIFLLMPLLVFSGNVTAKTLTPEIILNKYPACAIGGAFFRGICNGFNLTKEQKAVWKIANLKKTKHNADAEIKIHKNKLTITIPNDYFWGVDIENKRNNEAIVQITTQALGGFTLWTTVSYKIEYDKQVKNWKIVADRLDYRDGPLRTYPHKFTKVTPAVYFLK